MSSVFKFTVYGKVVGSARPRVTRNGCYIPKATREYRRSIRRAFEQAGGECLKGYFAVRLDIYRALPKSRPKYVEQEPDIYKPDLDNTCKNFLDALNGYAWLDDSRVIDLHVIKHPRTRTEERVEVTITLL